MQFFSESSKWFFNVILNDKIKKSVGECHDLSLFMKTDNLNFKNIKTYFMRIEQNKSNQKSWYISILDFFHI